LLDAQLVLESGCNACSRRGPRAAAVCVWVGGWTRALKARAPAGCRDYKADEGRWGWARPPPVSQKLGGGEQNTSKKLRKKVGQPCSNIVTRVSVYLNYGNQNTSKKLSKKVGQPCSNIVTRVSVYLNYGDQNTSKK
jgi:hypothetical protein